MTEAATSPKPLRPWWREPVALVFGTFILIACAGIITQGWFAPPKPVDPTKPAPVPGGGSFCDPAPPVNSTLERPK